MSEDKQTSQTDISNARTEEEIADFWDTHSLDEHWEQTREAAFALRAQRRRRITLDPEIYDRIEAYQSVWDAIADSPEEAANLKLRSLLMDAIKAYIDQEKLTQEEAAKRLGVTRSRVSELVNGRISKFTIDKLVNMAARVGLTTRITVKREELVEVG